MQVRILIDKKNPLNSNFLNGRFRLTKAMPRGRFSLKEEETAEMLVLVVDKAAHRRGWDPRVFFTPEKCQSLADKFGIALIADKFDYYPSFAR